ncbi:hypothetical protein [Allomuricauda sp. NBRC 101325]|uniref:pirin family protein n=1 Tax=Allomuricauda sp. NBRC 101325 TaxID=1113758 RepID=UPI0024A15C2A|nr:hypothetical protein [Muricauda sp. NBRC 101325]GLU43972.1 hypothetical protein Musp01_15960 [Muricauda sp. NBRC 101325]
MGNMVQQPAKIFLADKRYRYESNEYRCLSTPIERVEIQENVSRISDETLAPGKSKLFTIEKNTSVILMPLVGEVLYGTLDKKQTVKVAPEELQVVSLKKGTTFKIQNPSKKYSVNYIQIWLKDALEDKKVSYSDYGQNALNTIFESQNLKLHFGVLDGRVEAELVPAQTKNTLVAFVINGAFELQNRLLETRDSLMLWNLEHLELEALSENAIVLLLENYNS